MKSKGGVAWVLVLLAGLACARTPGAAPGEPAARLAGPSLWADLYGRLTLAPAGEERPAQGPTLLAAGADGRALLAAPLDRAVLVLSEGRVERQLPLAGTPLSLDARADGSLLALDALTLRGWAAAPGAERFSPLPLPAAAGHLRPFALRFDPDGEPQAQVLGNRSLGLTPRCTGPEPERGLPLPWSSRQAVALRLDAHAAEVRATPWHVTGGAPGRDPALGHAPERWRLASEHWLGAAHLVGEDREGRLYVVVEELPSRAPVHVRRVLHVLGRGGVVLERVELPDPSPIRVSGEWAVLPDGTFLLLRVEDRGASILAWRWRS
jgi:hypothetical protein